MRRVCRLPLGRCQSEYRHTERPSRAPADATSTVLRSPGPTTLLGTFDLDTFGALFGVSATTATVEGGKIRYVYMVGQDDIEFMIDPNDEAKTIIQSSFGVSDIFAASTVAESQAQQTWFRITRERQPDAAAWIQARLDDYLAAPGAEMSLKKDFGAARAGFYTIQAPSFDNPDPLRPAGLVGFYVEDRQALD